MISSWRKRWVGHRARIGEKTNPYRVFVGTSEGKSPLGRLRRRWNCNFKMDLREIEWAGMDGIIPAQDREQWWAFVNTVMNIRIL
jgi:hypothetical protein